MHGSTESSRIRALATALYHAAVEGAAPFPRTRTAVQRWLDVHRANGTRGEQGSTGQLHIIAVGKAAAAMTAGALEALGPHAEALAGAIVVTSHQPTAAELRPVGELPGFVDVRLGDHPVPGPASLDAADAIADAVIRVEPGDQVLVLLSGGTTALTAAPIAELSQQVGDAGRAQAHIANLAQTLLESGLAIHEMNAIRRRVLRWGAGRLAVALHARGARNIAVFAISDVIGDAPEVIGSGPCSPDPLDDTSLFALLDAHHLRSSLERDMALFLGVEGDGAPPPVPPADHPAFARVTYEYVARNRDAVAAMADAARRAGFDRVLVDERPMEGEAAELGDEIARQALATAATLPRDTRAVWIAGGEPVVHLRSIVERALELDDALDANPGANDGSPDEPMKGGRMQALALAAAMRLEERARDDDDFAWRIAVLAAGTDGRDGPTDAAGAIVDCGTPLDARRHGRRRPERDLATGRSWFTLDAAGALLRPGPTGTNVMDVVAVIIDARP